jgi:predicted phage terminase large subunit-like protein
MASLTSAARAISVREILGEPDDPFDRVKAEVFGRPIEQERTAPPISLRAFVEGAWSSVESELPFIPNWHVDAICEHLEWVAAGEIQRLAINIAPGLAKSILIAVMWPAWMWTWRPTWSAIFSSYDDTLSTRDSVRARTVMMSEWYRESFRPAWAFTSDQNVKGYYRNSRQGERLATSVDGKNTGFRAHCVAVDDPISAKDRHNQRKLESVIDWWDKVMSSRSRDQRTGARVIVHQRLNERDLTGHVLAKGGYQHLNLPTEYDPKRRSITVTKSGETWQDPRTERGELLFPQLITRDVVDQAKIDLGTWDFSAQHQQLPLPDAGGIFQRDWFKFYRKADLPAAVAQQSEDDEELQSWDLTFKGKEDSDFVVGQVWRRIRTRCYLRHERRGRMGFSESKRAVREVTRAFPHATAKLIEDKANGPAIIDELRSDIAGIIAASDPGGVLAQAWAVQPFVEAGGIYLPDPADWPEVEDWLTEVCSYPNGVNDDRVAAFTQAVHRMKRHIQQPPATRRSSGRSMRSWGV